MTPAQFRKTVWGYYTKHRRDLPWRPASRKASQDRPSSGRTQVKPYHILVSEIMLQQTQVDRVIPKYRAFIKQFPNFKTLAEAPQKDALLAWQGLGYNRRVLSLKRTAEIVWREHHGRLPKEKEILVKLPGIGPYTAGAIRAFAWNMPNVFIETNVRTVYIHHFESELLRLSHLRRSAKDPRSSAQSGIHDSAILELVKRDMQDVTVKKNTREWYSALFDYGAHLKSTFPNPSRKSAHHTKQSRFKGSLREARGAVLKALNPDTSQNSVRASVTRNGIQKETGLDAEKVKEALTQLEQEGFIRKNRTTYELI